MRLEKRIEKLRKLYEEHHTILLGDLVRLTGHDTTDHKVVGILVADDKPVYRLIHEPTGGQRTARFDQIEPDRTRTLERLLTRETVVPIQAAARDLASSVPRLLTRLETPPAQATRVQFNDATEWLEYLEACVAQRPMLGSVSFIADLRYAVRLWLQAILDHHFPEGGKK